jgi:hypothetical protein
MRNLAYIMIDEGFPMEEVDVWKDGEIEYCLLDYEILHDQAIMLDAQGVDSNIAEGKTLLKFEGRPPIEMKFD